MADSKAQQDADVEQLKEDINQIENTIELLERHGEDMVMPKSLKSITRMKAGMYWLMNLLKDRVSEIENSEQ